jgi:hypothetical protein
MGDLNTIQNKDLRMTPKAVAALFVAIAGCEAGWAYGIPGIIVGAIGLSLARKAQETFLSHPELYHGKKVITEALKWSKVAIIQGIILTIVYILYIAFFATIIASRMH